MLTASAGSNQTIQITGANHTVFSLAGSANDDTYSIVSYLWEVTQRDLDIGNVGWTETGHLSGSTWVPDSPGSIWTTPNITIRVKQLMATYSLVLHVTNSHGDTVTSAPVTVRIDGGLGSYTSYNILSHRSMIWDNIYPATDGGLYYNEFSRFKFTTSADKVVLRCESSLPSYGQLGRMGYKVDGTPGEKYLRTDGVVEVILDLGSPGVSKIVELVPNAFGGGSNVVTTTFFTEIVYRTTDSITPIAPVATTGGILLFGDSIFSSIPTVEEFNSMPMLLRYLYNQNVVVDAYGGKSLRYSVDGVGERAALLARWVARNPSVLWFETGTNDWGYHSSSSSWRRADYIAAAASLLTDFHAACPSCQIYWQSPVYRGDLTVSPETGESMVDFRAGIAAKCAAELPFVTYINGLPIIDQAYITPDPEKLHPNNDGHAQYAQYVAGVLGLSVSGTTIPVPSTLPATTSPATTTGVATTAAPTTVAATTTAAATTTLPATTTAAATTTGIPEPQGTHLNFKGRIVI